MIKTTLVVPSKGTHVVQNKGEVHSWCKHQANPHHQIGKRNVSEAQLDSGDKPYALKIFLCCVQPSNSSNTQDRAYNCGQALTRASALAAGWLR